MLSNDDQLKLKRSITKHEGYKNFPYLDTKGKITIGIGYNLTDRGISDCWINKQFDADIEYFYNQLMQHEWYQNLNSDRKIAILDASFMGLKTLFSFKRMIAALASQDYDIASTEMLDSNWAKQVGQRAIDLSKVIQSGKYTI